MSLRKEMHENLLEEEEAMLIAAAFFQLQVLQKAKKQLQPQLFWNVLPHCSHLNWHRRRLLQKPQVYQVLERGLGGLVISWWKPFSRKLCFC